MIRLSITAPAEQAELVLAALVELAPSGVEQVDGDGVVEYAVYGAPGELPALPEGEAEVGGVRVRVSGEEVPDDWARALEAASTCRCWSATGSGCVRRGSRRTRVLA